MGIGLNMNSLDYIATGFTADRQAQFFQLDNF